MTATQTCSPEVHDHAMAQPAPVERLAAITPAFPDASSPDG